MLDLKLNSESRINKLYWLEAIRICSVIILKKNRCLLEDFEREAQCDTFIFHFVAQKKKEMKKANCLHYKIAWMLRKVILKVHFATLPWTEPFMKIPRERKLTTFIRYEDRRHTSESQASNLYRIDGHTLSFVQHPSWAKDTPDMFDCLIPCLQIRNRSHQTTLAEFLLLLRRCYEHRKHQRNRARSLRQIPRRRFQTFRENDWRRERTLCASRPSLAKRIWMWKVLAEVEVLSTVAWRYA